MPTSITYGVVRKEVELSTDLDDETFVTPDEMVNLFNDAIDEAEAEIHTIYEDYYLDRADISLVSGTEEYALPATIYATKIRGVIFRNGSDIYEIKPARRLNKFERLALARQFGQAGNSDLEYFLRNESAIAGYKIVFTPKPDGSVTNGVRVWFLRNANKIPLVSGGGSQAASDAILIDIPEFTTYLKAHVKVGVYEKEGDARYANAVIERDRQKKLMVDTLTNMIPDQNDLIEQDLSPYLELS